MTKRRGMRTAWALCLLFGACDDAATEESSVVVDLFSAEFRIGQETRVIDLRGDDLGNGRSARELEMVVAFADPTLEPRTVTYFEDSVTEGTGKLGQLPLDLGQQMFVRGFEAGGNEPLLYGASEVFTIESGDSRVVGIQMGRADCVGLNAATSAAAGPRGSIDMTAGRVGGTTTLLPDGRVVAIGGAAVNAEGEIGAPLATIEAYDPSRGEFLVLDARLLEPRAYHTTTHLGDGRLLVFGGLTLDPGSSQRRVATETYIVDLADTAAPVKRLAGALTAGYERHRHEATLIRERTGEVSVLFTGGFGADGAPQKTTLRFFPGETGDPSRGELVPQGPLCDARVRHSATALVGRAAELAVVAGGLRQTADGYEPIGSVEVFSVNPRQPCVCAGANPTARVGCFVKPAGRSLESPRWGHRAVRIDDDRQVLFIGGYGSVDRTELARGLELLDAGLQMHGADETGSLPRGIGDFTATVIPVDFFEEGLEGACRAAPGTPEAARCRPEHQVVVTGGRRGDAPVAEVVRLAPRRERGTGKLLGFGVRELPDECGLSEARFEHQAVRMRTGTVLLAGGVIGPPAQRQASRRAELYFPLASNVRALLPTTSSLSSRAVP